MSPNHAQFQWKSAWRRYRHATTKKQRSDAMACILRYRREAALERKLAAAQRRIAELERYIDQYNQSVRKQDVVNKFLFS